MPGKRKAKGNTKRKIQHKAGGAKHGRSGGKITGGFHTVHDKTLAGQEDNEYTTMVFETTSAFTSTSGAASYLQIKGNSIYRPYPSVLSSPAGYARMYTQYLVAQVVEATCEVQCWSAVTGQDEPFRIIVLPCTTQSYTIYSAFSNISSLAGVPHAKQAIFSPGGKLPRVTATGNTGSLIYGESKIDEAAEATQTNYVATTGADPGNIWYFLVGYQNFAGTTTTFQQAQIKLTYRVRWFKPVATAEQAITLDYFGNEMVTSSVIERLKMIAAHHQDREVKREEPPLSRTSGKTSPSATTETKGESVGKSTPLLFGSDPDPESDDPEEVLFRKMLAARLGTVATVSTKPSVSQLLRPP